MPTIISNSIGQGEVAVTPLQLANMTAAIANRGHFFTPHVLKKVNGEDIKNPEFTEARHTSIDKRHFEPVVQGMADVYEKGTARGVQIPDIKIAGKTGTVENFTKIDSVKTQLTDNSVFVAFAPVDDPKIAIAVYIENGYYGARYAGHIASLMIEKYLKGENPIEIPTEILEAEKDFYHVIIVDSVANKATLEFEHKACSRNYSLAKGNGQNSGGANELVFTIKIQSAQSRSILPGVGSNYLCNLAQGQTIEALGPFEDFSAKPSSEKPMILIGAGSGMAPLKSLIEEGAYFKRGERIYQR